MRGEVYTDKGEEQEREVCSRELFGGEPIGGASPLARLLVLVLSG